MAKKSIDYEDFVDKFKPKKTTDDCYTPPSLSENDCLGVHHRGQNRYRDST